MKRVKCKNSNVSLVKIYFGSKIPFFKKKINVTSIVNADFIKINSFHKEFFIWIVSILTLKRLNKIYHSDIRFVTIQVQVQSPKLKGIGVTLFCCFTTHHISACAHPHKLFSVTRHPIELKFRLT